ncbi:MAG: hypothetical protein ACLSFT_10820 [Ruminococcus callidus]
MLSQIPFYYIVFSGKIKGNLPERPPFLDTKAVFSAEATKRP